MSALARPRRGDAWLADFDPVVGHEQGGLRPALILSGDALHAGPSQLVALVPMTSRIRGVPVNVHVAPPEDGLQRPTAIMCDQTRILSQRRLRRRLGALEPETMRDVALILRLLLGL